MHVCLIGLANEQTSAFIKMHSDDTEQEYKLFLKSVAQNCGDSCETDCSLLRLIFLGPNLPRRRLALE